MELAFFKYFKTPDPLVLCQQTDKLFAIQKTSLEFF